MIKKIISGLMLVISIGCSPSIKISDSLKEAWNVVNRDQDIYHRYSVLESDLAKVNQDLEKTKDSELVKQIMFLKMSLEQELAQEEQKIVTIQNAVAKASSKEINYLASL